MQETRSTCPYCGVGCGVLIESDGARITGVRGDPSHPANHGRLCTKGSTLHLTAAPALARQTRLLQPALRTARGAAPQALSWDAALDLAAARLAGIVREHGPDAVGLYVSGQLLTEDYYVFNKLAKGLIGTNNIDTNSRLCMSSAVAGYKLTLGADAPPACYEDVDHADCLFIVGSNTAWAHPILMRRIEQARAARPRMKIIVADPRRTETAGLADLFLPLRPGSDTLLFHGLLHIMELEGWLDEGYIARHTSGFAGLQALVRDATPERVSEACGLPRHDLFQAAQWFALGGGTQAGSRRGATLSLYCQGLNQSSNGTAKNAALINLHLATGQMGRAGAGPFSLTGQPNAMGGREVGGMANLLSAHRDLANPAHRAEVAALWGVDDVPARPGKTAVEMFEAAAEGEIRALWIACTNPAQSLPDQALVRRALQRAEFVIVQESFATTATCTYADLLLPASTWGEKIGTVTNSERRISRVRAAVPAPGQARHDWRIAVDCARRMETLLRPGLPTLFPYDTENAAMGAEAIWNEHRESTRGRDLDITGLSWPLLEAQGPQQWPLPEGTPQGRARLYEDGRFPTPDGRARFSTLGWQSPAEAPDAGHPFSLTTGRLRDQWHGMSRTGQLGRLFGHAAEPRVHMHAGDMQQRQLRDGDLVRLSSRRGSILLPVQADAGLSPSRLFVPMHWGGEYLGGNASGGINALTTPALCPASRQPELKHTAVSLDRAELPWTLLAMAWLPEGRVLTVREQLAALMPRFAFASCVPFGNAVPLEEAARARHGVLLRAAAHEAPEESLLRHIETLLGLDTADTLRYSDSGRQHSRALRLDHAAASTKVEALLLAGDTRAASWLSTLLLDQLPAQDYGRLLLMPSGSAPLALKPRARQVCACFDVDEDAIEGLLSGCRGSADARLAELQGRLRCGTHCGSCLPELKRMVRQAPSARDHASA
ncbi:Nitrate reductase [Delftia tsuruhatensis]|uniref:nitrate reductase n=1 Tax=Delftia tsuruhatensis TaxID=180282 RepID=UPI001E72AC0E|nr:nitrate reductase [Delftia tsuruhatensis]CAB5714009.1 Nitrate reductase [Delftia tsuruhatensis]CAC9688851.1 Nitrate reductase [Delftia tsuruhatensis]